MATIQVNSCTGLTVYENVYIAFALQGTMATGGSYSVDIMDSTLIKQALHHHFDNLCETINTGNIMEPLLTEHVLTKREYDDLMLKMEPLKLTPQAQMLLEFLMAPANESKLPDFMTVLSVKRSDLYHTLCGTITKISQRQIQIEEKSQITGTDSCYHCRLLLNT